MSLISPFVVLMFSAAIIPLSGLAAASTNVAERLPVAKWDFETSDGLVLDREGDACFSGLSAISTL